MVAASGAAESCAGGAHKAPATPPRRSTLQQRALWKALQKARLQGLSLRGIAVTLGLSRNTVRKYVRVGTREDSLNPMPCSTWANQCLDAQERELFREIIARLWNDFVSN